MHMHTLPVWCGPGHFPTGWSVLGSTSLLVTGMDWYGLVQWPLGWWLYARESLSLAPLWTSVSSTAHNVWQQSHCSHPNRLTTCSVRGSGAKWCTARLVTVIVLSVGIGLGVYMCPCTDHQLNELYHEWQVGCTLSLTSNLP